MKKSGKSASKKQSTDTVQFTPTPQIAKTLKSLPAGLSEDKLINQCLRREFNLPQPQSVLAIIEAAKLTCLFDYDDPARALAGDGKGNWFGVVEGEEPKKLTLAQAWKFKCEAEAECDYFGTTHLELLEQWDAAIAKTLMTAEDATAPKVSFPRPLAKQFKQACRAVQCTPEEFIIDAVDAAAYQIVQDKDTTYARSVRDTIQERKALTA